MQEQSLEEAVSSDATSIGYWRSGEGRPLVLVHGTAADHSRWNTVRGLLESNAAIYAMDRRGRGASGDADDYAIEREYEDVVAVVDTVARNRGPVDLLGHSYGAMCAMAAATITSNVRRLVLYEPAVLGMGVYPPGVADRLNDLLVDGRPEEALATFFREVVGLGEDQLAALRAQPSWPGRVAAATLSPVRSGQRRRSDSIRLDTPPWECRRCFSREARAQVLRASTQVVADALPDARVEVFEGHGHTAMDSAPDLFADAVVRFLTEP